MDRHRYFTSAAAGAAPFSDFEWFAVDRDDHVAFLTSGGHAAIPRAVFRSSDAYFAIRDRFRSLPFRGECVLDEIGCRKPRPDDWVEMARRGLFGFDFEFDDPSPGCPYRRVASPERPITVSELPRDVRDWLGAVRFEAIRFAETRMLLPEQFFEVNTA
jgi:hypothetical protein